MVIENDANAAAWGEFRYGAAHDAEDLLLVTVGTGVGGGLVLDGEVYRGANGVGAEIGHMRVVPNGILCGCGKHGCFEQYASGLRAGARGTLARPQWCPDRPGHAPARRGDLNRITGPLITEAAQPVTLARSSSWPSSAAGWGGHRLAHRGARPRGRRHRRRGQRGRRPAPRAHSGRLRRAAGRARLPADPQIRKAQLGNHAGLIGAADLSRR